VSGEVFGAAVAVDLVDDSHLVVDLPDVQGLVVVRDLDVDVPLADEIASVLQFDQLLVQSVHERLEHAEGDDEGDGDEGDDQDKVEFEVDTELVALGYVGGQVLVGGHKVEDDLGV
jgi:hypothetical protein